jgi:hypothetical protein
VRNLKRLTVLLLFVLLVRYFPVMYYTTQFSDFVRQETKRAPAKPQLHHALLQKADLYFLPVKPEDIRITQDEGILRVNVEYKVPVDLWVFKHELEFHANGAGLIPRR